MGFLRPLMTFGSALLLSTYSFAAKVNPTQGQVLVNNGLGYQQVGSSVEAGPGATVVANPGGMAQIVYPDGCVVAVQPGSVFTIAPESPCVAQGGQDTAGPSGAVLAAGAVVVGGGVAAVLLLNNGDKASSP